MDIWVVQGSSGDYSDHVEWVVCGFKDQSNAEQYAEGLSILSREVRKQAKSFFFWDETPFGKKLKELDPRCYLDDEGVNYTAVKIQIMD